MYPHERSLVKKMRGKPFALLGVNSDQSREVAQQAVEKEKLAWKSWFAGPGGGEIAKTYKIQGWPTLFLIDHKGVIREKWLGSPRNPEVIDQAIAKLLKEARNDLKETAAVKPAKEPAETAVKPVVPEKPVDDAERSEKSAASKLKFAKQLAEDGRTEKARERYQEIIKDYPKTKAAREARQLLNKLGG